MLREKKGKEGREGKKGEEGKEGRGGENNKEKEEGEKEKSTILYHTLFVTCEMWRINLCFAIMQSQSTSLYYLPPEGHECDKGGEVLHVCIVLQLPHL